MAKQKKKRIVRRREPATVLVNQPHLLVRHALVEAADKFGWNLFDLSLSYGALPVDPAPKGAIIDWAPELALRRQLQEACIPSVILGYGVADPDYHAAGANVARDLAAQGRLAAEHFADRGFRQVGYVGHSPWGNAKGLNDALHERAAELEIDCFLHQLAPGDAETKTRAALYERRSREFAAWLHSVPRPLGLLTYNDFMAGKLCVMAQVAGFMVPEDVAILGCGNDTYACETSPVALSSIDEDYEAVGRVAARLLKDLMSGGPIPPAHTMIPPKCVVERQSTNVLAVADPTVARALRFMWDHLEQDLSVNDVADEVGVNRQKLERAFRAHLHRGVNAELRRKRLEEFSRLLRSTDRPIADLAPLTGFRTMAHLHKTFRQVHGMSPRQYRTRGAEEV